MTENPVLDGGCACRAVRFRVRGPLRPVIACHCETCRRTSGHYWAATQAYTAHLQVTGEDHLTWFRSSDFARRAFCSVCGSNLFFHRDGLDRISIAAGTLDTPTGLRLVEEICTAEASDYYHLDEKLPRHEGPAISERWSLPTR